MTMLFKVNPIGALENLLAKNIPLSISYLSNGIWVVNRALVIKVNSDSFVLKLTPYLKSRASRITAGLNLGISFQYGFGLSYDKFVFNTSVLGVSTGDREQLIKLAIPENLEMVPRRNYQRSKVPASLNIDVNFWHRYTITDNDNVSVGTGPSFAGKLIDISAQGLQIATEYTETDTPIFENGQTLGLRLIPLPYETALNLNAVIKTVLPSADQKHLIIGLEMVGLEASPEGRLILSRIAGIVKQYQELNSKK